MKDQSQIDAMRRAIRGDWERAKARGVDLPRREPAAETETEPEPEVTLVAIAEAEAAAPEPEPEPEREVEPEPDPEPAASVAATDPVPELAPRRSFLQRLFGR